MPVATRSQRNVEDTPNATAPLDMLVVKPPTPEPTLHHGVCHTAALQPFTESANVPVALHTAVTNENHPKGKLVKSVPQKLRKGKKMARILPRPWRLNQLWQKLLLHMTQNPM